MTQMTVKQLAEAVDLHPETIRRWTNRGILKANRNVNGWRVFPNPDKTIKQIRGLLTGEIKLDNQESVNQI